MDLVQARNNLISVRLEQYTEHNESALAD